MKKKLGLKAFFQRRNPKPSYDQAYGNIPGQVVLESLNPDQYYELTPGLSDAILRQATTEPSQKPDIIIFPTANWELQSERSRQLVRGLAGIRYRIFYVQTGFSQEKTVQVRIIGQNVYLVRLALRPGMVFPDFSLSIDDIVSLSSSVAALAAAFNLNTVIVKVDQPFWWGLADQLCDEYTWKLVYDCLENQAGILNPVEFSKHAEQQLFARSDLVIFSSPQVQQKLADKTQHSITLPVIPAADPADKDKPGERSTDDWKTQLGTLDSTLCGLFPKISIVVVTFNKLDYTRQCLDSIIKNTEYPNYELVIVDNASVDGTADFIEDFKVHHANVNFIRNDRNLGFAAANNLGADSSGGEYLVLLNNDTLVTPGWLHRLLFHLNKYPKAAMVGPVTNAIGNEARIKVNYQDLGGVNYFAARRARKYNGISFRIRVLALYCAMISRDLYEQLGGLDERYHVGMFEDDDLALKIQQAGFYLLCAEDVFIHHFHGASFNQFENQELQRIFHENKQKFEEKWGVTWQPHQTRPNSQ